MNLVNHMNKLSVYGFKHRCESFRSFLPILCPHSLEHYIIFDSYHILCLYVEYD